MDRVIWRRNDLIHICRKAENFGELEISVPLPRASPTQPAPRESPRAGTQQGYRVVAV